MCGVVELDVVKFLELAVLLIGRRIAVADANHLRHAAVLGRLQLFAGSKIRRQLQVLLLLKILLLLVRLELWLLRILRELLLLHKEQKLLLVIEIVLVVMYIVRRILL